MNLLESGKKLFREFESSLSILHGSISLLFSAVICGVVFFVLSDCMPLTLNQPAGSDVVLSAVNYQSRFIAVYGTIFLLPIIFVSVCISLGRLSFLRTRFIKTFLLTQLPLAVYMITHYEKNAVHNLSFESLLFFSGFTAISSLLLFYRKIQKKTNFSPEQILGTMFCAFLAAPIPALISGKALLFLSTDSLYILHKEIVFFTGSPSFFLLFPGVVLILSFFCKSEKEFSSFVLLPVQILLLAGYAVLLPENCKTANAFEIQFPPTKVIWLLGLLLAAGVFECIYRVQNRERKKCYAYCFSSLAAGGVIALYLFRDSTWNLYMNWYETGNRVVPYMASRQEGMKYFKDLFTSFGLWDYIGCLINEYLHGKIIYFSNYGQRLLYFFSVFVFFLAARKYFILPMAALLTYFMAEGFTHSAYFQSLMTAVFLFFLAGDLFKRKNLYLILLLIMGLLFPFLKYPQGCAFSAAMLPLAIYIYAENKKDFLLLSATLLIIVSLFLVLFLPYFQGLLKLSLENMKQNALWSATTWNRGFMTPVSIVTANWSLLCPFLGLFVAYLIWKDKIHKGKYFSPIAVIATGSVTTIFYLLCCNYSFARFDNVFSRQTIAGSICGIVLLCMFMRFCHIKTKHLYVIAGIFFVFLLSRDNYKAIHSIPQNFVVVETEYFIKGEKAGLVNLGDFPVKNPDILSKIEDIARAKKKLSEVLPPEETFINISDFAPQILFNRKLALFYSEAFPIWGEKMQNNLLAEAKRKKVYNILFGKMLHAHSCRNIYRTAVLMLKPVRLSDNYLLMIPPGRFKSPNNIPGKKESALLLEEFFYKDLKHLPIVYGNNLSRFQKFLKNNAIDISFAKDGDHSFFLYFRKPVSGKEFPFLFLQFQTITNGIVELSWQSEISSPGTTRLKFFLKNGNHLVPMDCSPNWLLSERISMIRITLLPHHDPFREEGDNIPPTTNNVTLRYAQFYTGEW